MCIAWKPWVLRGMWHFFWLGLQAGMHEAVVEVLVHPVLCDPEVTFIKEDKNSFHMSILCVFQWSS